MKEAYSGRRELIEKMDYCNMFGHYFFYDTNAFIY